MNKLELTEYIQAWQHYVTKYQDEKRQEYQDQPDGMTRLEIVKAGYILTFLAHQLEHLETWLE